MPPAARLTAVFLAASIVALAIPATTSYADGTDTGDSTVIVTFETNQTDPSAAARAAVTAAGGTDIDRVRPITAKTVAVTLNDTSATEAEVVNSKLESQSAVRAADTSVRFHATQTNDSLYGNLWNLNNAAGSTYGVDAEDAWTTSKGSGSVVAVIDSGIIIHSDLTDSSSIVGGNVLAGYDFISDPKYSIDGDGYDSDPTDVVPADEYHGTHVAGTVAAIANNAKGVVGVAPEAKVQPVRVLGKDGGSEEDIVAAIRWAAGLSVSGVPTNPTKADVINLSLGGSGTCGFAMQAAINAAVAAGTAVVAAAGNDASSLANSMPADCANVIRVTASTNTGGLAYYSNYGTSSTPATIAAPGGSATTSTDPDPTHWILSTWRDSDGATYAGMEGTSMAAPHVSGILALMKAANPSLTVGQLTAMLTATAQPFSTSACSSAACGVGVANASTAVALAEGLQLSAPTRTATTRVGTQVTASASVNPSSAALTWQWLIAGTPVTGATSAAYTPLVSDYGKALAVRVTASSEGRLAIATSPVSTVGLGVFTAQNAPKTKGTYKVGHKLTASAGTWSPTPTGTAMSYQWLRNGKTISGATGVRHKITKKDKHKRISVRVTVRASGYTTQSATSASHKVK